MLTLELIPRLGWFGMPGVPGLAFVRPQDKVISYHVKLNGDYLGWVVVTIWSAGRLVAAHHSHVTDRCEDKLPYSSESVLGMPGLSADSE